MLIHFFLAAASAAETPDPGKTLEEVPSGEPRGFARHFAKDELAVEPEAAPAESIAVAVESVGPRFPLAPTGVEIAEPFPTGQDALIEAPECGKVNLSDAGHLQVDSIEDARQGEVGGPRVADTAPRPEAGAEPALPRQKQDVGASADPRLAPGNLADAIVARPERFAMLVANDADHFDLAATVQTNIGASEVIHALKAELNEGRANLHGPALSELTRPEKAKALGLERAPGLVGSLALPESAVAKGIQKAVVSSSGFDEAAGEGSQSVAVQLAPTIVAPEPGAMNDSGAEIRTGTPEDRPSPRQPIQTGQLIKEKIADLPFVAPDLPESPADIGVAVRPAESQSSGAITGSGQPLLSVASAAPAIGLGSATVQQLALAIRRSGEGEIEIALEPEELGKVRLTVAPHDSRVTVSVFVERPETLDLIRRHIDALTSDLRQQGYTEVSLDFAQGQSQDKHPERPDLPPNAAPEADAAINQDGPVVPLRPSKAGGLDLRI